MFVDHRNIPVCASGTLLQTVHTQLGKLWHAAPYIMHCLAIEYLGSMFDTKSGGRARGEGSLCQSASRATSACSSMFRKRPQLYYFKHGTRPKQM